MYYLLYTKSGCHYCNDAIELLHVHKKEYVINECTDDSKTLLEVKKKCSWGTVPIIFECRSGEEKKFIGGYDDLKKYFEEGE